MEKITHKNNLKTSSSKILLVIAILTSILCVTLVSAGIWDDILYYWDFNEASGTNLEDIVSGVKNGTLTKMDSTWAKTDGILDNGLRFSNSSNDVNNMYVALPANLVTDPMNWSINFWVNITEVQDAKIIDLSEDDDAFIGVLASGAIYAFEVGESHPLSNVTVDKWQMITVTRKGTNVSVWQNATHVGSNTEVFVGGATDNAFGLQTGGTLPLNGSLDEIGLWNETLTQAQIDELYNSGIGISYGAIATTLHSPANNSIKIRNVVFNASVTSPIDDIVNMTLYIDNVINETQTITGSANSTTFSISGIPFGIHTWTVDSCTTDDCNNATTWDFTIAPIGINNETYSLTATETDVETFAINISYDSEYTVSAGVLDYNGTLYTGTQTAIGDNLIFTVNATMPIINVEVNKSFYWNFTLSDGAITYNQSATNTQTVSRIFMELCNATYTVPFLNFTTRSATNPFPTLNSSFKISWDIWLGTGDIKRNQSYEDLVVGAVGNHTFDFCVYPAHENYNISSQVEVDATDYSKSYHYLTNATISNTTNEIGLYLLNNSLATLTVLTVQDGAQNPIEGVDISIQFYDVGTDTFYTIGMARSSFNGEDVVYLNWYDSLYKFILTKNGEVIKQTTPYKILETPQIFEVITEITYVYDKFANFIYNLYYNDVTQNFVLTFTKPSGLVDKGCLWVYKRTSLNDTTICNTCETSSSATLYCNVAAYGNGTYYATFYATGSYWRVVTITEIIGTANEIFDLIGNVDGTVYAFLFAGIVLGMFLISPIFAVVGVMLGMLGAIVIGFQPFYIMEFIGIIILGGVVIWLIKR